MFIAVWSVNVKSIDAAGIRNNSETSQGNERRRRRKKKNNTQFIPFYKYHFINKIQLPAYFTHLPHSNRSSLKRQRMKWVSKRWKIISQHNKKTKWKNKTIQKPDVHLQSEANQNETTKNYSHLFDFNSVSRWRMYM